MKWVVNATHIARHNSGLGRYARELLAAMLEQVSRPLTIYVNERGELPSIDLADGHRVVRLPGAMSPEFGTRGHGIRLAAAAMIGAWHPKDLLFAPSQLEVAVAHRHQVVTIHDLIPLMFPADHHRQAWYFEYLLPRIARHALHVVTVSHHTRALILQRLRLDEQRVTVIYPGLSPKFADTDDLVPHDPVPEQRSVPLDARVHGPVPPPPDEPYLFWVGRPTRLKNLQGAIDAVARLPGSCRLPLWATTQPNSRLHIPRTVTVRFLGPVSDATLRILYRRARALVVSSLAEGFGLPVLEAMALGCPVAAFDLPSLREIAGPTIEWAATGVPEALASAVEALLANEEVTRARCVAARERAQAFQWTRSASEHLRLFAQVSGVRDGLSHAVQSE